MMGQHPDKRQIGVVWAQRRDLATLPLSPASLRELLADGEPDTAPLYLGVIE